MLSINSKNATYLALPHVFHFFFPINKSWIDLDSPLTRVAFPQFCWSNAISAFIFRDFISLLMLYSYRFFQTAAGVRTCYVVVYSLFILVKWPNHLKRHNFICSWTLVSCSFSLNSFMRTGLISYQRISISPSNYLPLTGLINLEHLGAMFQKHTEARISHKSCRYVHS